MGPHKDHHSDMTPPHHPAAASVGVERHAYDVGSEQHPGHHHHHHHHQQHTPPPPTMSPSTGSGRVKDESVHHESSVQHSHESPASPQRHIIAPSPRENGGTTTPSGHPAHVLSVAAQQQLAASGYNGTSAPHHPHHHPHHSQIHHAGGPPFAGSDDVEWYLSHLEHPRATQAVPVSSSSPAPAAVASPSPSSHQLATLTNTPVSLSAASPHGDATTGSSHHNTSSPTSHPVYHHSQLHHAQHVYHSLAQEDAGTSENHHNTSGGSPLPTAPSAYQLTPQQQHQLYGAPPVSSSSSPTPGGPPSSQHYTSAAMAAYSLAPPSSQGSHLYMTPTGGAYPVSTPPPLSPRYTYQVGAPADAASSPVGGTSLQPGADVYAASTAALTARSNGVPPGYSFGVPPAPHPGTTGDMTAASQWTSLGGRTLAPMGKYRAFL